MSFADKETAKVFGGAYSKKLPRDIQASAQEKMIVLDKCEDLRALWKVPGLNCEKLIVRGADNCWSLRINRQWRIVFFWSEAPPEATAVEICDYH